jgi:uncharacterized protein (DUF1810 family)
MDMSDRFHLARFVEAQQSVWQSVLDELQRGQKTTHWMWFVFPQIRGLGRSETARFYAISGREEAGAYLQHDLLGPRLRACTELVNRVTGRQARDIFPPPDDLKFRSSMTLFAEIAQDKAVFATALTKYFAGLGDTTTLTLL